MQNQMALYDEQSETCATCGSKPAAERFVMPEVVIDNNGHAGEVVDEKQGFILVRWNYGQFALRRNRICLNADGLMDYRARANGS